MHFHLNTNVLCTHVDVHANVHQWCGSVSCAQDSTTRLNLSCANQTVITRNRYFRYLQQIAVCPSSTWKILKSGHTFSNPTACAYAHIDTCMYIYVCVYTHTYICTHLLLCSLRHKWMRNTWHAYIHACICTHNCCADNCCADDTRACCAVQPEDDDWDGDLRGASHTASAPHAYAGDMRTQGIMRKPLRPSEAGMEKKPVVQIMTPRTMQNSRTQNLSTSDLSYGNSAVNSQSGSNVIMQYSYTSNGPSTSSRPATAENAKNSRSSPTFGRTSSGKQPTVSATLSETV